MNTSENINELVTALSKAQGQMQPAERSGKNNHFKSDYMKLEDAWIACKKPLADNELSVVQLLNSVEAKHYLITILSHSSGQWMKSNIELPIQGMSHQDVGKCITYYKKFSLTAIVGIYGEEDDDGEGLAKRGSPTLPVNLDEKMSVDQLKELAWRHAKHPHIITPYLTKYGVDTAPSLPSSCYNSIIAEYKKAYFKEKEENK